VNDVVDYVKGLWYLVNAEKCICVENEDQDDLPEGESTAFKWCIASIVENIAAVAIPGPGISSSAFSVIVSSRMGITVC